MSEIVEEVVNALNEISSSRPAGKARMLFWPALLMALFFALPGEGAGVYVSIGSFRNRGIADRYVRDLKRAGIETFTERIRANGKTYTRVTVLKNYHTIARANKAIGILRKHRVVRKSGLETPWIFIGTPKALRQKSKTPRAKIDRAGIGTADREKTGKAIAPVEKNTGKTIEPIENNAGKMIAPVEKNSGKAIEPIENNAGKITAPVEKNSGKAIEPIENNTGKIIAPIEKNAVKATEPVGNNSAKAIEQGEKYTERVIEPVEKNGHRIVSIGNAGVMEINDKPEKKPLEIIQVVPGQGNKVGPRGPLMVFLNDRVYVPSISGNMEIVENGTPIPGTVNVLPSSSGYAILSYVPLNDFKKNSSIRVRIKRGIKDAGGNTLARDTSFQVSTGLFSEGSLEKNLGFEKGMEGIAFQGDGCVLAAPKGLDAPEGKHFAALSTGLIFTRHPALMHTTSMMTAGPVNGRLTELSFKYNFASAEFNEHIGSPFDDSALLIITGTNANKVFMIESVNKAGHQKNSLPYDFIPGFPDVGESNGITGWKEFSIKNLDIRGPITLMFVLSDVGDREFSSMLFIDDIRIKTENK